MKISNHPISFLELIEVPTVEVYDEGNNKDYSNKSILSAVCIKKIIASAEEMFVEGIKQLKILTS